MFFVGAAFGGPPDILCYCKDCQRQPLLIITKIDLCAPQTHYLDILYIVVYNKIVFLHEKT